MVLKNYGDMLAVVDTGNNFRNPNKLRIDNKLISVKISSDDRAAGVCIILPIEVIEITLPDSLRVMSPEEAGVTLEKIGQHESAARLKKQLTGHETEELHIVVLYLISNALGRRTVCINVNSANIINIREAVIWAIDSSDINHRDIDEVGVFVTEV